MKKRLYIVWAVLGAGLVASFQNCGKGFQSQDLAQISAQCQAKIKESAPDFKLSPAELNCSDFNKYSCEKRIFSPDIADMTHSLKECLPGGEICVDVDVREFNTAAARSTTDDEQDFAPGGSYNHQEVNCSHRMVYRGVTLFDGHSDSLEGALAEAMSACEKAENRKEP